MLPLIVWGAIKSEQEYETALTTTSGVINPFPAKPGVFALSYPYEGMVLIVDKRCPAQYVNDSRGVANAAPNIVFEQNKKPRELFHDKMKGLHLLLQARAVRPIAAGDQLFVSYGDLFWEEDNTGKKIINRVSFDEDQLLEGPDYDDSEELLDLKTAMPIFSLPFAALPSGATSSTDPSFSPSTLFSGNTPSPKDKIAKKKAKKRGKGSNSDESFDSDDALETRQLPRPSPPDFQKPVQRKKTKLSDTADKPDSDMLNAPPNNRKKLKEKVAPVPSTPPSPSTPTRTPKSTTPKNTTPKSKEKELQASDMPQYDDETLAGEQLTSMYEASTQRLHFAENSSTIS
jgi:hypothetical protein